MDIAAYKKIIDSQLFKTAPVVIFIWRGDKQGSIEAVSSNVKRLYGYAPEAFISGELSYAGLIHPDDLPAVSEAIERSAGSDLTILEHVPYRLRLKDGSYHYILDNTTLLRDENGIAYSIGYLTDFTTQHDLQEALWESDLLWRATLDTIHYAVVTGTVEGTITGFNKEAERMLEYRADELIGKATPSIFHDPEEIRRRAAELSQKLGRHIEPGFDVFIAEADSGSENEHEWTYITKSGKRVPVTLSVTPLTDARGKVTGYVGISKDISQEHANRMTLLHSQQMLNSAQRIAKIGSWSLDLKTNRLEWSDEIFRIFEIDKEQFEPSYEGFLNAIHPDDIHAVNEAFSKSVTDKTPYSISHRLLMKDGRIKYVIENGQTTYNEAGEALYSEGTVQDITEFKELEIAYQGEHRLFSTLINSAESVIAAIDRDGVMVSLNRYGKEFTGYTQAEIGSEPFFWERLLPESVRPNVNTIIEKARNKEIVHRYENSWISCTGEERLFEWSNALVLDDEGEMKYIVTIGVDITRRKILEQELAAQKEELETILDTSMDGIAILDLETNFLFFNRSYQEMTGFSKAVLLTKSCAALSAPEDIPRSYAVIEEVRKKGFVRNFEKSCIVEGGRRVRVNMSLALMPDQKRILISTKDVTQARLIEKKVKDYVGMIDEYIITSSTDLDGTITSVSKAFCRISGYQEAELIGQNHRLIRHPDMPEQLYKDMWEAITHNITWEGEIKNLAKDGSFYWVKAAISPFWDDEGKKIGYTAIRQDITDKKRVEELSVTDRLTGLFNRMKLDEVFSYELERSNRYGMPLSVIILDVDHFKSVNDTYGHQVGDSVLQEVAGLLQEGERHSDTVGRWGGEEFLIILPESDLEGARSRAEILRKKIEAYPFPVVGSKTASFGIAQFHQGDTETTLLERADQALYKAKQNGRNRVEG